jgi:glycosyltransferase involved in cell wall biosynthesis
MHIAVLTDGITPFETGGMQRHSFHLVKNLLKKGLKITLVHCITGDASFPGEKDVMECLDAPGCDLKIHTLRFPKLGSMPGHYLKESYKYSCMIHDELIDEWRNFDFIYAKGFTAWCLLEEKKKGKHFAPIGVKFHGYEMFQKGADLKGKIEQFMLRPPTVFINRNADVVFSYGGVINSIIEGIGVSPDRIVSIPSGVEDEWIIEEPLAEKAMRKFLFIGRNEKRKGLQDLKALEETIESLPVEFHFIGPIPERKQFGSAKFVWHGEIREVEKLKELIDRCQVLVSPSHSEGMPNVILEAMARGLAVIATRVGAVPQLVGADNGMLVPPKNRKALAHAMEKFAEMDAEKLMELRRNGRNKVSSDFRWSEIADQMIKAIEKVTFT